MNNMENINKIDNINVDLTAFFKEHFHDNTFPVEIAMERESLRLKNGKISQAKHPKAFEPKLSHKYITTDFAESQVELITPVFNSRNDLYNFSNALYDICSMELEKDEYLLAYSLPLKIESEDEIKEATFDDSENGVRQKEYRKHLIDIYGKKIQAISGIHFNFSIKEEFLEKIASKNEVYMKIARNYNSYKFLTVALLGASPICDKSFIDKDVKKMVSIRNSTYGYRNKEKLNICYDSVECFIESVENAISDGKIVDEREIYSAIRIKTKSKKLIQDLKDDEIKYIEIRNVDLNPYEKCGISLESIEFLKCLIMYCLIKDDSFKFNGNEISDFVAMTYDFNETIPNTNLTINELIIDTLNDMIVTLKNSGFKPDIVEKYLDDVKKGNFLYKKVYEDISKKGYEQFLADISKEHKKVAHDNRFKLYGFENMELSTQILMREAIKQGFDLSVLDEKDNFIKISKGERVEYIKQATKTSLDNYVTVCAMENKVVTKKILEDKGIKVPKGDDFTDKDDAFLFAKNMNTGFVIKPKSTNFGLGINIFSETNNLDDVKKAIDIAFSYDDTIIIEEFIKGNEYRFLVIGDETVAVLNRVPANVVGDGNKTITELVEIKNQNPLRGKGYKTPLEKIVIDDNAKIFLKNNGLSENYIPKLNESVYLRQNSNVSTGGDSIDLTDDIPNVFKEIAVNSAKAVGAKICGVDIIIENYEDENSNYSIIELNFNPAIHIHSFPYKGVERNIAEKIIKLFQFN